MTGNLYVRAYKEQYASGFPKSTTHVHGLDAQVHNYSPECGGCYNCNSVKHAFEQYCS